MQHCGEAGTGAEVVRVGCDGEHGPRRRLEQVVVDERLTVERDGGDLGRHREDDVEVPAQQQVGLPHRSRSALPRSASVPRPLPSAQLCQNSLDLPEHLREGPISPRCADGFSRLPNMFPESRTVVQCRP